ncbi:MAG TPA: CBS domain-containing protein, partial [Candidatus Limnocylindrales bacterium]|nr:CBS domain-containing protein [Candidatus Limnocylindrales bacterium]
VLWGAFQALGGNPDATPGAAILYWLALINVSLGVFNMLPGFPLDGGRVLRSVIWGITSSMERATRLAARVGQGIALVFIVAGIYQFFRSKDLGALWISFIGWFLLQAAGANYLEVEMKHALEGLRAGDLMSRDCAIVEGPTSVQDFVDHHLLRTGRRCFIVTVQDRMAGLITPNEVRTLERDLWPVTPVQQIMKPLNKMYIAKPETPVMEVLETMAKEDLNQVPVVADQQLQGMLTRGEILQALKSRTELRRG